MCYLMGPLGSVPSPARVGDVRRAGTLGQSSVGCVGVLGMGEMAAPYQGCRGPVKLSLSRGILAKGQSPMGVRTPRCLWGGGISEGHAGLPRSPVALLLARRETPQGCFCGP